MAEGLRAWVLERIGARLPVAFVGLALVAFGLLGEARAAAALAGGTKDAEAPPGTSAPATAVASGVEGANVGAGLFAAGLQALQQGRPDDAVSAFELLADQGVVDAAASFDRALAYAERVRSGTGRPGDLGRAAHGFEEARLLARDAAMEKDAVRGLAAVRGEVARRQVRAGEPVEVERGGSLGLALALALPEDAWALGGIIVSILLAAGLFIRGQAKARRVRIAATLTASFAAPILAACVALTLAAREHRVGTRQAVVVSPSARLSDERAIALAAGGTLPEGALVDVVETRGALQRIRWGGTEAWVSTAVLRAVSRSD